ncbi:MAG: hypothetical protein DI606_00340 [Sphingobium sp.]|uniref:glycosyltransferase family 4 protein n=1 Tax=Sphingobium sp. TaxID=1912891 RepID=UPI000DB2531B|nr:glycosyltransferase [Sphingobium sp.]PZU15056.1 MAG: hypothetical protein DI606_00340 [Sphingobium sp.]
MTTGTNSSRETKRRRLLVVGGSHDHLGGVEAFCERGCIALEARGRWSCDRVTAGSAYLTMRRIPLFLRSIGQLIHRGFVRRPDVAWIQYVNLPDLFYVVVARAMGMRVMVTPHLGSNWRSQMNPFMRRLSKLLLHLTDRLALISWTQEKELLLPRSVPRSLIRNFLPDTVLSAPLIDGEQLPAPIQLIHSSRLSEGKGTFMVVDVCRRLRDAGVPFFARITGTGDAGTMQRLHRMIADARLESQVAVLGRVPENELLDHLRHSDVLIHLSRIDSYPLIVLEAMSCSTVPVVMELAGARDMVETYRGHVVSVSGAVDETVAWLEACDLQALRRERRETAERVRTDYSWSNCASALSRALDACMDEQRETIDEPRSDSRVTADAPAVQAEPVTASSGTNLS